MSEEIVHLKVTDGRLKTTISRHQAFWRKDERDSLLRSAGVFAPSAPVHLPQPDGSVITSSERLHPDMVDPSLMIDELEALHLEELDAALSAKGESIVSVGRGDLLPSSRALPKIPWIEAMLGCPIKMTEGQIWSERYPRAPEEVIRRGVSFENNPWFQLYLEFLHQLQVRLGDRFPVSANTLFRGTSDLAAAILGVQEACLSWLEEPKLMHCLMQVCADANLAVIEAGHRIVKPFQGGYLSSYGLWAPAPVLRTQADHSTLVSPELYREHILPYDLEVVRSASMSVFHMHNSGLHIAPLLVKVPEISAIEVTVDPYPKPARKPYEIKMLQLIQKHKPLILYANFPNLAEVDWMLSQLSPCGLSFNARFDLQILATLPSDLPGSTVWLLS
jgi:hypothetical protein